MLEVTGKYTNAKIFANICEAEAQKQILDICSHPLFENNPIRVMPDVHSGAGCVIGFTAKSSDIGIIPNLIGVDIGCSVSAYKLPENSSIDLSKLDRIVRSKVPSGFSSRSKVHSLVSDDFKKLVQEVCNTIGSDYVSNLKKIGTLGGGNHFISVENGETGSYLLIHTGSRKFGHEIASYFMKIAESNNNHPNKDLCYLEGSDAKDYMYCMNLAMQYAKLNHRVIAVEIFKGLDIPLPKDIIFTSHNYADGNYIRKGSVSADDGEVLLIPINMRDGTLICRGRGNEDWNNSAPHGAGRLMSRSKAKKSISMEEYKNSMEGIFSSSINEGTLDEAPFAYKNILDIMNNAVDTVDLVDHLKPVYNFKS